MVEMVMTTGFGVGDLARVIVVEANEEMVSSLSDPCSIFLLFFLSFYRTVVAQLRERGKQRRRLRPAFLGRPSLLRLLLTCACSTIALVVSPRIPFPESSSSQGDNCI